MTTKALAEAINNDNQIDTLSSAVLEVSDRLKNQGERIVAQDKTIAIAEHRVKQTSSEIDEKMEKYDSIIDDISAMSQTVSLESEELRNELQKQNKLNKINFQELSDGFKEGINIQNSLLFR